MIWSTASIPRDGKIGKHGGLGEEDGGGRIQPGICRTVFRSGKQNERRPGEKCPDRCHPRNITKCVCGVDYTNDSDKMRETNDNRT